jgi:hypothetical protein
MTSRFSSRPALVVVAAVVEAEPLEHLLGALEAEVSAADDEQPRQNPGREGGEQHRDRDDDQELVRERPEGDATHDRKLPCRREPLHVLRGDGRVVDHDACGLGRCLQRRAEDVIDDGEQTYGHACNSTGRAGPDRRMPRLALLESIR